MKQTHKKLTMRGGAMRRFTPTLYDVGPQYGGALSIPAVAKMLPSVLASAAPSKKNLKRAAMASMGVVGKKVKRRLKRKAQGLANRVVDRAAGALAKRAKRGVADLLGV